MKKEEKNLKNYADIMQENTFKFKLINYWRNIDKKIFLCFIILFFLGLFFSFSSTSSLAGERLNKNYYFFFSKHLIFTFFALIIIDNNSFFVNNSPVGLLGLQRKIHPFLGICKIKESKSFERLMDLK